MSNICILHKRKLNVLESLTERECSSHISSPFHCQHAKVEFPVMVSTVRCADPVNESRCKWMRNPPQEKGCAAQKVLSREKSHPGGEASQALVTTHPVSDILDKLSCSSSPSCPARYHLTCKVCLCIWQPGASVWLNIT